MRISDWSSDVCSSDLLQLRKYGLARVPRAEGGSRDELEVGCLLSIRADQGGPEQFQREAGAALQGFDRCGEGACRIARHPRGHDHLSGDEIGRASCRERWCQYV